MLVLPFQQLFNNPPEDLCKPGLLANCLRANFKVSAVIYGIYIFAIVEKHALTNKLQRVFIIFILMC